jgi:uncharacterized protein (DUF1501 family)
LTGWLIDQCVSALIEDLHVRGLSDDCAVIIWGEFGRTPKISDLVGRDHWPQVNCALMAGGGLRHGQVIGATDRIAGEAIARPVTFGEVYATLFHHLGISVDQTTIADNNGRPQYLVEDDGKVMPELVEPNTGRWAVSVNEHSAFLAERRRFCVCHRWIIE